VIEPHYATVRSTIGDLNTRIENGLSGIELVKTTSTEEYENERVRGVSRDVFDAEMDVLKLSYFYRPGMELITGTALLATFVIGGLWVFSGPPLFFTGELSIGEFVVFMLLTQRLTGPMTQLSNIVDWYENVRASGKRIFGLMDVSVRIENGPNPIHLDSVEGRVEYDDVTFAYETGEARHGSKQPTGKRPEEAVRRYWSAWTSRLCREKRSLSSGRRARANRLSLNCCCGSTT
jgi:ATP-binding cassette subfamily B protein